MDRFGGDFGAFGSGDGYEDPADDSWADDGAHSNPPPSPVGQDERRMQVRAYNHWASQLGEENLPHIEDLEPEFLGDFGPYSVLFDFSTGSGTPTIQFIGSALRDECRLIDPIETLKEIPADSLLSKVAANYLRVVAAQAPVTFEAETQTAQGRTVAYRGVLLPYSSDYDTIDFVYAVVNWKEVADASTADALLNEIDAALAAQSPAIVAPVVEAEPARTAEIVHFNRQSESDTETENIVAEEAVDPWASHDNILEMRGADHADTGAFDDLPVPNFGQAEEEDDGMENYDPEQFLPASEPDFDESPAVPKRNRAVDALGNPIGGAGQEEESEEPTSGGITTAADYGLPEWDEEEEPEDDVDDLVNPLANIDLNSRLLSLVNSGSRGKKTVDLATLSDTPSEEDEVEDERQLFKPKAPSVDTLLTPQAYDEEEDEADEEEAYAYSYEPAPAEDLVEEPVEEIAAEAYEFAPAEEEEVEAFLEEPEAEEYEPAPVYAEAEPVAEEPAYAAAEPYEPAAVFEEPVAEEPVYEAHETGAEVESYDEPVLETSEAEAFEEPLELGEELILDEEFVEEAAEAQVEEAPSYQADTYAEPAYEEAAVDLVEETPAEEPVTEAEQPEETAEWVADVETDEAPAIAEGTPVVLSEEAAAPQAIETSQPESLHGLLAAVHDLAEAARTTEDRSRRALYEAVGRAFDVSIKAVIAAEGHGQPAPGVVEQLPVGDLDPTGPELALVMVRRHRNGETEVIGEVPHDSILMETAQLKLASR